MAATVFAGEGAAARGGCSAECATGSELPPDLGSRERGGDGCGKRSVYLMECVPLWGCAATRGHAAEMEDACAAVPRFADVPVRMLATSRELGGIGVDFDASELRLPAHLFGVYDGHGGSEVANYCRDKIHVVLRDVLRAGKGLGEVELGEVDVKEPWEKVFGDSFQKVDDEVSGMFSDCSREPRAEPVAADNVGSTAVVAIVCSSHVIAANCGDSRVVLCRGKEPIALSIDHKPDRKDELARIEAAGGKVIDWNGYRVSGILAMSRSIGDRYLKPFVIPKPEVTVVPRAKDDDCLILASDGLWDVMSNEDACKIARRQILLWHKNKNDGAYSDEGGGEPTMNPAAKAAADCLVRLALMKGSNDNISVIVIDLKSRKKPKGKS
ncbi:protein phosphatase 2C 50-like [Lolium rigidum]|uniref:protein phosphatase 2C 50-like n=1 Tax=Lolium rigidum TaxID=89674 RepID=UPI001F5C2EF2|nr:protein phosphatase 2C 50-like [Lolium rigidum]XP_051225683.1 protein phosphatase 2C 50-like [Lolium perenne]